MVLESMAMILTAFSVLENGSRSESFIVAIKFDSYLIEMFHQLAPADHKLNDYHRWLWKNYRSLGLS
jgi:hypothetical protein